MNDETPAIDPDDDTVDPIPLFESEPKSNKPRYMVVGNVFVAQSDDGEVKIPLRFKTKLIREIRDLPDEMDQVFALLAGIGDRKTADQLDELDIYDTAELVTKFFQAFQEKQKARLGESSRSSTR